MRPILLAFLAALAIVPRAFADTALSQLPTATTVSLGDYSPAAQAGANGTYTDVKESNAQVLSLLNAETKVTSVATGDYVVMLPSTLTSPELATVGTLENRLQTDGFQTSGGSGAVTQTGPTSFTPVMADGGTTGFTYTGNTYGTYVKTGRVVTFNLRVEWSAKDNGTGAVSVTGLPVGALANGVSPMLLYAYGITTTSAVLYGLVGASGTISIYAGGSTGTDSQLQGSALGAAAGFYLTGTFISAS